MPPHPSPRLDTSLSRAPLTAEGTMSLLVPPPREAQTEASTPASRITVQKMPLHVQYKQDLAEYRTIFNENMKNKPVKHKKVFVFMWTWNGELDDLKVKDEVWNSLFNPFYL